MKKIFFLIKKWKKKKKKKTVQVHKLGIVKINYFEAVITYKFVTATIKFNVNVKSTYIYIYTK